MYYTALSEVRRPNFKEEAETTSRVLAGRDAEEKEEQWLVFQEAIAVTSSVKMPRPTPSGPAPSVNLASLSPVKIDATTSIEALKVKHAFNHLYCSSSNCFHGYR